MSRCRQKYSFDLQQFSEAKFLDTKCASLLITNYGTVPVFVEGVLELQQGQSFSIDGNENEILVKPVRINFAAGAGTKNCIVVLKNYID